MITIKNELELRIEQFSETKKELESQMRLTESKVDEMARNEVEVSLQR